MILSTAKDFFTLLVEPTVDEFIKSPHDLRRGLLAAIVLNQMADHVAMENFYSTDRNSMDAEIKRIRENIRSNCQEFQFIQDVADATKHAKLSTPKKLNSPVRGVLKSEQLSSTPGLFEAGFSEGVFLEGVVVFATLNDGSSRELLPAVEAVLEAWRSIL